MIDLKESITFNRSTVLNPPDIVYRIFSNLKDCKSCHILESCYLINDISVLDVRSTYKKNQIKINISDNYLCTLEPIIIYERCIHELVLNRAISLHSSAVLINKCVFIILGRSGSGKTTLSKYIEKYFSGKIVCDDTLTIYVGQNSKVMIVNPLYKSRYAVDINNAYILKLDKCSLLDCMIRPDNADQYIYLLNELNEKVKPIELQYTKNTKSIEMVKEVIKSLINVDLVKKHT